MAGLIPLTEIAEMSGVSASTVSRYMNRKCVAPRTAQRIEACLVAKGYPLPASRARGAAARLDGRSDGDGPVCVLLVGKIDEVFRLPAFPELLGGVQRAAMRHGRQTVFVGYDGEGPLPMDTIGRQCRGFLVLDQQAPISPELASLLDEHPAVFLFRRYTDERRRFDQVYYDNRVVGEMAAFHLCEKGCKSFLFASHQLNHKAFMERREDFRLALAAAGAEPPEVVEAETPAALRMRLEAMFSSGLRPDGVFAAADDILPVVWLAAKLSDIPLALESGNRHGMHLVGCNNDPAYLKQMHPRPATIDLHLSLLGERAFELLTRRMAGFTDDHPAQWVIAPELLPPATEKVPLRRRGPKRAAVSLEPVL